MGDNAEIFENNCKANNGKYYVTKYAGNLCCKPNLMTVSYMNPSQPSYSYQCANGKAFVINSDECSHLEQFLIGVGLSQ